MFLASLTLPNRITPSGGASSTHSSASSASALISPRSKLGHDGPMHRSSAGSTAQYPRTFVPLSVPPRLRHTPSGTRSTISSGIMSFTEQFNFT
jgi:hypothetical protein